MELILMFISFFEGWNLKWLFLVTEHPITLVTQNWSLFRIIFVLMFLLLIFFLFLQQSPTDDYSNLQDSTDDSKVSETMTRGKIHLTD